MKTTFPDAVEMNLDEVTLFEREEILNSRIEPFQPGHNRTSAYPLSSISDIQVQSGLIYKDLLFTLLGYEGLYTRFSEKYDPEKIEHRVKGPDYKIARHLDISLKSITKRLVRFGKYYSGLNGFVQYYDNKNFGKVVQKFCYFITDFLNEYRRVIIRLEDEFKFNGSINLSIMENRLNQTVAEKLNHLYEIALAIHNDSMERKIRFKGGELPYEEFIQNIRTSLKSTGNIDIPVNNGLFQYCKGGLVLEIVQKRINNNKGDFLSLEFLTFLLSAISEDYITMLNKWLMEGVIDDQFEEFIVREKPIPTNLSKLFNPMSEHYWNELFVLRAEGSITQFQNADIQLKIINTGRFLNIFKSCTGLENFESLNETLEPIGEIYSQDLDLKIDQFYHRANKLLMKLIFEGFDMFGLVQSFQRYFLFDHSSNIDRFLEKTFQDLKKNRYAISVTRLKMSFNEIVKTKGVNASRNWSHLSKMEQILNLNQQFAITSSNFYDIAKEIMNVESFDAEELLDNDPNLKTFLSKTFERSQIKSAESHNSEYDPDHTDEYTVASVDLAAEVPFPLNLVINRELSYHYELMFKLKMLVKFINTFNNNTWREINFTEFWRYPNFDPRIRRWILKCRILHSKIRSFIDHLQYYIDFTVIEPNYNELVKYIIDIKRALSETELGFDVKSTQSESKSTFKHNLFTNFTQSKNIFGSNAFEDNSGGNERSILELNSFSSKLNEYLNTIVNDSLITRPELLSVLKNMLDITVSFNNYLSKLKKGLILCDRTLFERVSAQFPSKFVNKSMDEFSIETRIKNLNDSLQDHAEIFEDSLTEFVFTLKSYGEAENEQILNLTERLEMSL